MKSLKKNSYHMYQTMLIGLTVMGLKEGTVKPDQHIIKWYFEISLGVVQYAVHNMRMRLTASK